MYIKNFSPRLLFEINEGEHMLILPRLLNIEVNFNLFLDRKELLLLILIDNISKIYLNIIYIPNKFKLGIDLKLNCGLQCHLLIDLNMFNQFKFFDEIIINQNNFCETFRAGLQFISEFGDPGYESQDSLDWILND